jgi:hypothetical protein
MYPPSINVKQGNMDGVKMVIVEQDQHRNGNNKQA